jgi:hypothetical protein
MKESAAAKAFILCSGSTMTRPISAIDAAEFVDVRERVFRKFSVRGP